VLKRLAVGITAHTAASSPAPPGPGREAYADTNSSVTYPVRVQLRPELPPATSSRRPSPWSTATRPGEAQDNLKPQPPPAPVNRYGLGIEHRLPGGLPLRFGVPSLTPTACAVSGWPRPAWHRGPAGPVAWPSGHVGRRRSYNLGQATGTPTDHGHRVAGRADDTISWIRPCPDN